MLPLTRLKRGNASLITGTEASKRSNIGDLPGNYLPDGVIPDLPPDERDEDNESFVLSLEEKGYTIYNQTPDGHCAFRSISMAMYNHPHAHGKLRRECTELVTTTLWTELRPSMELPQDATEQEEKAAYRLSISGNKWAGPIELQALTRITGRPIHSHIPGEQTVIYAVGVHPDAPPIELSFHKGNHYNYMTKTANVPAEQPADNTPAKPRETNKNQLPKPGQTGKRTHDSIDYSTPHERDGAQQHTTDADFLTLTAETERKEQPLQEQRVTLGSNDLQPPNFEPRHARTKKKPKHGPRHHENTTPPHLPTKERQQRNRPKTRLLYKTPSPRDRQKTRMPSSP